ncbi:MAG TPA: hypothetical protein GXX37_09030 [Clostridiaceae bacterium]|nr:hypothetical protein [Clostridiaceae bacterium]
MIKIELTTEEKYRLERVSKAEKGQTSFRANMILLNNAGMSAPAIAKMPEITYLGFKKSFMSGQYPFN